MINCNEYHEAVMRTAPKSDSGYDGLLNGVMGLCGESGEAIDLVKKFMFQGHELEREKLAFELGDILWYLDFTATQIGYTLPELMWMNKKKLEKRYPTGFDAQHSIHRPEYEVKEDK